MTTLAMAAPAMEMVELWREGGTGVAVVAVTAMAATLTAMRERA